ncbi:hypothetical protein [Marivirga sp.]|uniref:coiled-coil domain-containing protein n=1 Tax=Marivirga sp. TaxID=2018662 RepID=UPI002D80326C|nr:hypothetical protein [Marivirga sp.]HET8859894.1 hypothetical protein [Marivirga sp.]
MKNYTLILFLVFMVSFTSCQNKLKEENAELKEKISELRIENDKLRRSSSEIEVSIDQYETTLDEIDENLKEIAENQASVSELKADLNDSKDKDVAKVIRNRISQINAIIENSRIKIMNLTKSLVHLRQQSGAKSEEILALDKRLEESSKSLIEKENEITELRNSLEQQLSELEVKLENQISISNELETKLNEAFYLVADSKTLKEKEIVNKEGGFIGLGRVKVINAEASDSLFNKAKKDELMSIELNSKKVKLISIHSEDSYELVENSYEVERLNILKPDIFWKDTNYLVIEIDK